MERPPIQIWNFITQDIIPHHELWNSQMSRVQAEDWSVNATGILPPLFSLLTLCFSPETAFPGPPLHLIPTLLRNSRSSFSSSKAPDSPAIYTTTDSPAIYMTILSDTRLIPLGQGLCLVHFSLFCVWKRAMTNKYVQDEEMPTQVSALKMFASIFLEENADEWWS